MNKIIVSAKLYHETVYCSFKTFFSLFQQWRKYNLSRFLHKSFIILTYNCNQIWKYKTTNCLKLGSVLQNLDTLLLPSKVCKHSLRQRQQIQLNQFLFAKFKVLHYFTCKSSEWAVTSKYDDRLKTYFQLTVMMRFLQQYLDWGTQARLVATT